MRRPLFSLFICCLFFAATTPLRVFAAPQFLDDEAEIAFDVNFSPQKTTSTASSRASSQIFFDFQNAKNSYILDIGAATARFVRLQNGVSELLSSAPLRLKPQTTVTLQRRAWMMRLLIDGQVALTAFDPTFHSGKIGIEPGLWNWKNPRVQPVESVRLDDDFTRAGEEGDQNWSVLSGKWSLSASGAHVNARTAGMSSNPFSYEALAPTGTAMATSGRKFWDSYDARVSVRPNGRGAIGIAANVLDARNYLAFWWAAPSGTPHAVPARRLVRVQNGVVTVLASAPGAFLPRGWYEIGLRTSPGFVEALIDGVPVLRAPDNSLGQGGIGLLARDIGRASFDDVRVRSYDFFRQNVAHSNGAWVRQGDFQLTGSTDWDGYRLLSTTSPKLSPTAALGLIAGYQNPKNYVLFRAAGPQSSQSFRGRQQIVRWRDGKPQLLSDSSLSFPWKQGVRLMLSAQNGALVVSRGEQIIAQAAQSGLTRGQTGLWDDGPWGAGFEPETVLYFPPLPEPIKVAAKMEDDPYMIGWASNTGEWPPTAGENGLEFWNTGEFFGDSTLDFPWRFSYNGKMEIALRAQRGQFYSGFLLRGESSADKKSVNWTLLLGEKVLGVAQTPRPSDAGEETAMQLRLQGQGFLLLAAGDPVLSALLPSRPPGHALALRAQGFRVRTESLHAQSANRDDTTFTRAPTDFYSPSGTWSIFSRWPCYGDWSFFGGQGLNPVLWTKRTYGGDVVAEFYAHPQMILPKEPGYAHPGDLNITLCGDGKNPSSGYSFIVAGWDNTRSQLLRGTQVLAENWGDEATFHDTTNQNMQWHRRWFYLRAEARLARKDGKTGVQITLTIDDKTILSAFDPAPLPLWKSGGRTAFWTLESTLMIARAKIEAEKMGAKSLPAGLLDASFAPPLLQAPRPLLEGETATALVTKEKNGWRLQNPVSGGSFEVQLGDLPLNATPQSRLQIEAQIPSGVKIDAYCLIDGQRFTIGLTGDQKNDAMAPLLGPMTRNGALWSFSLGAALQTRFPTQKSWKIERLTLGARHGDAYRYQGFDGNLMGDNYFLGPWKLN